MRAGMATHRPATVQISASAMPPESARGSPMPPAWMTLKERMMPVTVPSRPSSGDTPAIVPSVLRKRSSSWTTARPVAVGKPRGQESAEGRVLLERRDNLVIDLVRFDQLPHALRQLLRQHALVLQGPQALQNDGRPGDRAQNDRPHQRAAGPHNFPHPTRPLAA